MSIENSNNTLSLLELEWMARVYERHGNRDKAQEITMQIEALRKAAQESEARVLDMTDWSEGADKKGPNSRTGS